VLSTSLARLFPRMKFWRRGTVTFALLTLGLRAEDHARAPELNPARDSLTEAKQAFDNLKTPRASTDSKTQFPQLETPGFIASPTVPATTNRPTTPPKKNADNWLVDGAMKKSEQGEARAGEGSDLTSELDSNAKESASDAKAKLDETKSHPSAFKGPPNPLDAFMATWISPQDRSLLRAGNFEANSNESLLGKVSPRRALTGSSDQAREAIISSPRMGLSSPAKENPYLEIPRPGVLEAASASTVRLKSEFSPAVAPPPTLRFTPADVASPPASPLLKSELTRSAEEQKYFPQLKRF
jgi:hypothetical protein